MGETTPIKHPHPAKTDRHRFMRHLLGTNVEGSAFQSGDADPCVSVFSSRYWWQSPPDQGETCPLCSVFRGLLLFSVFFCPARTTAVVSTHRAFIVLMFLFSPPSSCGACLHFYRVKGSAVSFPRRPPSQMTVGTRKN